MLQHLYVSLEPFNILPGIKYNSLTSLEFYSVSVVLTITAVVFSTF